MTTIKKVFIEAKYLENAETTQYTASNVKAEIDKFTATNVTAGNVTVSVSIVPSGGAASTANRITYTKTIPPGQTWPFPELVGHVLEAGDFISTLASAANAIVGRASGREYS